MLTEFKAQKWCSIPLLAYSDSTLATGVYRERSCQNGTILYEKVPTASAPVLDAESPTVPLSYTVVYTSILDQRGCHAMSIGRPAQSCISSNQGSKNGRGRRHWAKEVDAGRWRELTVTDDITRRKYVKCIGYHDARTWSIDTSLLNLYKPQARPLLKFPAGSPLNLSQ